MYLRILVFQQDFHVRLCSCRLTVTQRMSRVEQELLTLPEHMNAPRFLEGFLLLSLLFSVQCFVDLVCPFVLWPLCSSSSLLLLLLPGKEPDSLIECNWFRLCCLSFFDLRLLITPLVSSNFSY